MTFLNAIFLLGAIGVMGPVLAHLLARPRFKKIPFTMMQFLHAGELESQSRRKIRNLLLLLIRCMIIVFIVLAFAGPRWERVTQVANEEEASAHYIIAVDDSLSMRYENRFAHITNQLHSLLDSWPADSIVSVHGLSSSTLLHEASMDRVRIFLDEMKTTTLTAQVAPFINTVNGYRHQPIPIHVVIASDYSPSIENELNALASRLSNNQKISVTSLTSLVVQDDVPTHNISLEKGDAWSGGKGIVSASITVVNHGSKKN